MEIDRANSPTSPCKHPQDTKRPGRIAPAGLDRLVHVEEYDDIHAAIVREKAMKAWKRAWKIELVERLNPDWDDVYDRIA